MSVIETPPKDRMAIQTVVAKFDEKIMRSAVEVELERGGQVYFVHNRVESILRNCRANSGAGARRRVLPWATGR
jgi:transcription-repair coupling factor (superfamily II helicase)